MVLRFSRGVTTLPPPEGGRLLGSLEPVGTATHFIVVPAFDPNSFGSDTQIETASALPASNRYTSDEPTKNFDRRRSRRPAPDSTILSNILSSLLRQRLDSGHTTGAASGSRERRSWLGGGPFSPGFHLWRRKTA